MHFVKPVIKFFICAGILLFIILMFGLSAIPFTYLLSFMAKTQAKCFTISIMINILAGKRCLCYNKEICRCKTVGFYCQDASHQLPFGYCDQSGKRLAQQLDW